MLLKSLVTAQLPNANGIPAMCHGLNKHKAGHQGTFILLYGLPGAGKSMVAQACCEALLRPYMVMSGGDIARCGQPLVGSLHLFRA